MLLRVRAQLLFFIFVETICIKCDQSLDIYDSKNSSDVYENKIVLQGNRSKIKNLTTAMYNNTLIIRNPKTYCAKFKKCSDCTKSVWYKCNWCHNFGCTDKPSDLCPKLIPRGEPCPNIYHEGKGEILIPSGVRTNVKVKLHAPDPVIRDKEIICQIKLSDRLTHLKGLIIDETIYCYPVLLNTKGNELIDIGTVEVIWGGATPFSNKVPIAVYNCETMGITCESCKMIPIEYGCGWCQRTGSCVIGDKCSDDYMTWTLNRMTCDDYQKKLFYV